MVKKSWSFNLQDGNHVVQMEQGYFSTKRRVRLDGKLLEAEVNHKGTWLGDGEYTFGLGSHSCMVVARNSWLSYSYDRAIDGLSITSGKPLAPLGPIPKWAWLFVAATAIIPIISLGGALPVLVGLGGAVICASIARNTSKSTVARVILCIAVTAVAWVLFLALVLATALLRS